MTLQKLLDVLYGEENIKIIFNETHRDIEIFSGRAADYDADPFYLDYCEVVHVQYIEIEYDIFMEIRITKVI